MSSSAASRAWRPGHVALGASLALLAHAAFSAVHFSALAAGRYGEAARALRVLPRDVLAELALALALALASVLLFSEALLPLDGGAESALNSLHRLLAPRADFAAAAPLGLGRPGATDAQVAAEKLLGEVLRDRRKRAREIAAAAAAAAAEAEAEAGGGGGGAGSGAARGRVAARPAEAEEEEEEEEEEEGEGEEQGDGANAADEPPEDVD